MPLYGNTVSPAPDANYFRKRKLVSKNFPVKCLARNFDSNKIQIYQDHTVESDLLVTPGKTC